MTRRRGGAVVVIDTKSSGCKRRIAALDDRRAAARMSEEALKALRLEACSRRAASRSRSACARGSRRVASSGRAGCARGQHRVDAPHAAQQLAGRACCAERRRRARRRPAPARGPGGTRPHRRGAALAKRLDFLLDAACRRGRRGARRRRLGSSRTCSAPAIKATAVMATATRSRRARRRAPSAQPASYCNSRLRSSPPRPPPIQNPSAGYNVKNSIVVSAMPTAVKMPSWRTALRTENPDHGKGAGGGRRGRDVGAPQTRERG